MIKRRWLAQLRGAQLLGPRAFRDMLVLLVGQPLLLLRESDNSHDRNAIRVTDLTGRDVGYVAREIAARVAPVIDAGYLVLARVATPWRRDATRGRRWPIIQLWVEEPTRGVERKVRRRVPA